ncbi:hypothetical protein AU476_15980, partial [Cupriavidus sp. UYMSc13B]
VISKGRLEFDAGWTDFAASFMSIRKTTTAAGGRVTYQAAARKKPAMPIWPGPACMRWPTSRWKA